MSDLSDLPLFAGVPAPEPAPKARSRQRRKPERGPTADIVALPLVRNRRLVADLVDRFVVTAAGPDRANRFRSEVLAPLAEARRRCGLSDQVVAAEFDALEDAMVVILSRMYPREAQA